jgi:hypothetical protein
MIFLSYSAAFCYDSTLKEKIEYIKNKYEHTMCQKQYLFFPATKPVYLFIIFTSAVKNKYEMWSWFWNDAEIWSDTAYLFLKDDDICWYLGNDKVSFVESYSHIINYHIALTGVAQNNVFTIGGSMGGYAAIFYATILGLGGAIAYNPQINKSSNSKKIRFALENTGNKWINLDELLALHEKVPAISLLYGAYSKDFAAACDLLHVLKDKKTLVIFRHVDLKGHKGLNITKKYIEGDLNFFKAQDPLTVLVKGSKDNERK